MKQIQHWAKRYSYSICSSIIHPFILCVLACLVACLFIYFIVMYIISICYSGLILWNPTPSCRGP